MDETDGIPEYFKDKHVFITGGFGLLGKLLLEKLLYSCPDLAKVYVIVRSKRGQSIPERMEKAHKKLVFDRIKATNPDILNEKLVILEGDITLNRLGLSEETYNDLTEKVNIVAHLAATIKFNEPLDYALNVNVLGTKKMIEFAMKIKNLESFVHVSTAYAHCTRNEIEEVYYEPKIKWHKVMEMMETTDKATFRILSPKITDDYPNTYVFSKMLAEDLVWDHRKELPIVITRPSIVISCWKEPMPGWIDNLLGPAGFMFGAAKGVIRVMYSDSNAYAAYVPADMSTRATIAAMWYRHKYRDSKDEDHIYNINHVESKTNANILKDALEHLSVYPLRWSLWNIDVHQTKSYFVFMLLFYFKQLIPAIFIDLLLIIIQQKPILLRIQKKYYNGMNLMSWFILRVWNFRIDNFLRLDKSIPIKDQEIFAPSPHKMDAHEYLLNGMIFGRRHYLKDPPGKPYQYWIRAKMLVVIDKIATAIQIAFAGYFSFKILGISGVPFSFFA